ncbi:MAG: Cif family virulence factor [Ktedonobacteraceae bacterium]
MYNNSDQPPQQPERSLRWLWMTLSIVGGLLLISCASYVILSVPGYNLLAPTMSANATADAYYQAIENKDYTKAYSYLAPDFPVGAHERFTGTRFIASLQAEDTSAGPVTSFTQLGSGMNNDIAIVTMSITRGGQSYTVQLQLQQNKGTWQIIHEDDV